MANRLCSGGVVLNGNKVLVVYQKSTDSWSLPKGHILEGEESIGTTVREIYEESGVTELNLIRHMGYYERPSKMAPGNVIKGITMYLFTTDETELNPIDPENPVAKWVDVEQVSEVLSYEADKKFFKSIQKRITESLLVSSRFYIGAVKR